MWVLVIGRRERDDEDEAGSKKFGDGVGDAKMFGKVAGVERQVLSTLCDGVVREKAELTEF